MKPIGVPHTGEESERTPATGEKKEGDAAEAPTVSKTSAVVLILAIGVHALFEGIAFGLQTEMENAIQLALGILIHKSAAAVSIGGAFARSGYTTKWCIIFVILFAITTPIGILIGMAVTESNKLVDTIFMSTSGGTFIYVACSEIVINEFDKGGLQWLKMLLFFIGGLLITVMWFFGHHHHHGGEGDHGHHHLM